MDLHDLNFGIEIEFTGITRYRAAQVAAEFFNTRIWDSFYHSQDAYQVPDENARVWKCVYDGSIIAQKKQGNRRVNAGKEYRVELVSPICQYDDIPQIQDLIRQLRNAGAFASKQCGIHIHVDASAFDSSTMKNLVNIMASKEDLIFKALQVQPSRIHYCEKLNPIFVDTVNQRNPKTLEQLMRIWNGQEGMCGQDRYHSLNLCSVSKHGTVEYRLFNSDIQHTGKVKAYIQLCLAITAQALNQRSASREKTISTNEKYTFRTWLIRLGMNGDEFKTAREHLLEHLDGCIAWKDPAQAERQKERQRQAREAVPLQQLETETASHLEVPEPVDEEDTPVLSMSM